MKDKITQRKYSATMTVRDVEYELELGRSKAYDFIRRTYITGKPFRVVMVDNQYRVVTASFFNWLNATSTASLS